MTIPEELLPVVEWWEKDGKKTLAVLALAGIAAGGYFGWKAWREHRCDAAGEALLSAYTTDELEEAVKSYGGEKAGLALKQRLAGSYFAAERYEEALALYDELKNSPVEGYEDVPAVGRAECLEALGRHKEALGEYESFIEAKPKSLLLLTARLGAARMTAVLGDRKKAIEALEAAKKEYEKDANGKARIESAIDLVKRFDSHAAKPVEKPAEKPAAKADAKPAEKPAAKPEAKPAAKPEAKPVAKPEAKPAAKPAVKADAKPAEKPAAKPAEKKPAAK